MRISYFYNVPVPSRHAAPIQILNTCRALAEQGAEVVVYTGDLTAPNSEECLRFYGLSPHPNLHLVPLASCLYPGFRSWKGVFFRRRLAKILADPRLPKGIHYVLSRDDRGIRFFQEMARIRPGPNIKRIFEAHRISHLYEAEKLRRRYGDAKQRDVVDARRVKALREAESRVVESADGILCLTAGLKQALEASFRVTCPIRVLPSGTDVVSTSSANAPKDIDILYVGKLQRRKGVGCLVDAMKFLPEFRLTIVGGEQDDVGKFSRLIAEKELSDRVTLTGFVEPRGIPSFLSRCRVGVCPLPSGKSSIAERFTSPLKILEMMGRGVPVVASDLPSVREILEHDRTALLVPPDDPAALAAALRRVLTDPVLAVRLGEAGRARAADFSWERRAKSLLEFISAIR